MTAPLVAIYCAGRHFSSGPPRTDGDHGPGTKRTQGTRVTDFGISPDDLRRLAKLIEQHGLSELRYEEGDLRVTLRTDEYYRRPAGAAVAPAAFPLLAAPTELLAPAAPAEPYAEDADDLPEDDGPAGTPVEAPIMGVFYRAGSPDSPPLVEVGDTVEVGQAVGLIEAMKVFSEVKSEIAGRVAAVVAQNRQLVQPGDPLVLIEPAEGQAG
jgi:acetyl-CoA carboxylase biotin carboxyl carrier protein